MHFELETAIFIGVLLFFYIFVKKAFSVADSQDDFGIREVPAISDSMVLTSTIIPPGRPVTSFAVTACRGEYEPLSFVLRPRTSLSGVQISVGDLEGENGSIPSDAVDIRVVKCWFQAGTKIYQTNKRILVSELLLKDDKLIRVDQKNGHNYMRQVSATGEESYVLISGDESIDISNLKPLDAPSLRPTDIDAGENKQFFLTVRVPESASSGIYKGKLRLTADNAFVRELPISLNVLPFDLEKPALRYGLYYRGKLPPYTPLHPEFKRLKDNKAVVNDRWKLEFQYRLEMENMKAHGVDYPTMYQNELRLLSSELLLRQKAGLPMDALYSLGVQTGNATAHKSLMILRNKVQSWKAQAAPFGVNNFYVYGKDEAKGEELLSQRHAWMAVKDSGGRIFAAVPKGAADLIGDLICTAIVPGPLDERESAAYHNYEKKIFSYSNPQVGEETPETYRRNYGVSLWKTGYDGAMNYAYQHAANHVWNDFDHQKYRDHVFAYPTIDGVIDTLQFEGFREGIDDARYLAALQRTIEDVCEEKQDKAVKAQKWLDSIDAQQNLNSIRRQIIEWIMILRKGVDSK
ncbi:MAG: DUF4091 domain-containing protein [Negativicutes bacterium]|nr:DUF4091 domain-containing protein [Negativicutes bacterium]